MYLLGVLCSAVVEKKFEMIKLLTGGFEKGGLVDLLNQ